MCTDATTRRRKVAKSHDTRRPVCFPYITYFIEWYGRVKLIVIMSSSDGKGLNVEICLPIT